MHAERARVLLLLAGGAVTTVVIFVTLAGWREPERRAWTGFLTEVRASPGEASLRIQHLLPLSPAARTRLEPGDEIVAINGSRFLSSEALADAARTFRPRHSVTLTVRRPPSRETFRVSLVPEDALRNPALVLALLLNLVTGLAFVMVGAFVYMRRSTDPRATLFFAMCTAFALVRFVNAGPWHSYALAPAENLLPAGVLLGSVLLLFPLLLHFSLVFPRRRPALQRSPAVVWWIYGLPVVHLTLVTSMLAASGFVIDMPGDNPARQFTEEIRALVRPLSTHATLICIGVAVALAAPAMSILRRTRAALRCSGVRAVMLGRPALTLGAALIVPLFLFAAAEAAARLVGADSAAGIIVFAFLLVLGAQATSGLLAHWLVFPIAACVAFYRSYREAALDEKRQVRWPLWGVLTAVSVHLLAPLAALALIAALRLSRQSSPHAAIYYTGQYVEIVCLILIPVTFAFAILKHRLMDIHVYIRRTAIYGCVIGILAVVYAGLIGGLATLVNRFTGLQSDLLTAASTLAVAAVFVPVRNRVRDAVDRHFFRRRDFAASLTALGRELAEAKDEQALAAAAVDRVQVALQCRSVVLLLRRGSALLPAAMVGSGAAEVVVDIHRRDAHLGTLSAGPKLSDEPIDTEDRAFLGAAAGQIAVGIENLRLRAEQRDLERAREIQAALLPASLPEVPGVEIAAAWQPARSVAGDYYDVLDLGTGQYAVVIADVSGKGLPAALLMSNLQAAVKAFAVQADSPALVCSRVNHLICSNVTPGTFVTFFYGVLDTTQLCLTYANAGHNAPVLHKHSGDVLRLETGGLVLGFRPDVEFNQEHVVLHPGDTLVMFTDGLTEAFDPSDEEFGDERLVELISRSDASADELKTALLAAVSAFCGGVFSDDATLVTLRIRRVAGAAA